MAAAFCILIPLLFGGKSRARTTNTFHMTTRKLQIVAAVITSALTISAARADVLVNGGFEAEPNANPANGATFLSGQNDIPGWTITPGTEVTLHSSVANAYPTISGVYSVNTDSEGFNGHNAQLYQDFTSALGNLYNLTFNWETWQVDAPGSFLHITVTDQTTSAVLFNGLYDPTAVPDLTVQSVSAGFTGTGDTLRLEIQETPESGNNDNQFIVDNFDVEDNGNPNAGAPDATGWSAEITAALGLIGFARRKFRK